MTLKETIMTALDRPGKSPPKFFLKSTMSQIQFLFMEWGNFVTEKNEGIPFSTEIQVVGSYTDRLLTF